MFRKRYFYVTFRSHGKAPLDIVLADVCRQVLCKTANKNVALVGG